MRPKPVVLIILDGFGYDKTATESPWQLAEHPIFSEIEKWYPFTTLQASGIAVGLPWGEEGNSEVGHLTIGAGRAIFNHLPRIITAIHEGDFFKNKSFLTALEHAQKNNSRLHIIGLFSSGSVHAYVDHLYALLDLAKNNQVKKTYLHLFTDGRDAPLYEATTSLKQLDERLEKKYPGTKIASVVGRYYAMDRDGKWDNVKKAYQLLVDGKGEEFEHASLHVEKNYKKGITDEFIEPGLNKNSERIQNGDAVIFFNYREDSARELTAAFVQVDFDEFERKKVADLKFVTMTEYNPDFPALVAFPPLRIENPLAKIISLAGLRQLRIAESEKYAHVTYFFNGGKEQPFEDEERILAPSPNTPHYDEVPEMSARAITDTILKKVDENIFDFIVINFANADMVGHTGNFEACVKALETLDECVGRIIVKVLEKGGVLLVTADHGNVEEKIYKLTGEKRTKHTANPVPFYLIGEQWVKKEPQTAEEILRSYKETKGILTDIAPTILDILELKAPEEMTGENLLLKLR